MLRLGLSVCTVLLLIGACVDNSRLVSPAALSEESDSQLIDNLISGRTGTNQEILKRGARMVPLLVKLKGDQRPYVADVLGHHLSATSVPLPVNRANAEPGELVTIEVAALYLINAIYHNQLEFAQSAYLTDLKIPVPDRRARNLPDLVSRAWESTEAWSKRLSSASIEDLRSRQDHPLRDSGVAFW